jgi:hypothetical protein
MLTLGFVELALLLALELCPGQELDRELAKYLSLFRPFAVDRSNLPRLEPRPLCQPIDCETVGREPVAIKRCVETIDCVLACSRVDCLVLETLPQLLNFLRVEPMRSASKFGMEVLPFVPTNPGNVAPKPLADLGASDGFVALDDLLSLLGHDE